MRQVVREHNQAPRFRLRKASFGGRGLQPELGDASWVQIRALAYRGWGG